MKTIWISNYSLSHEHFFFFGQEDFIIIILLPIFCLRSRQGITAERLSSILVNETEVILLEWVLYKMFLAKIIS